MTVKHTLVSLDMRVFALCSLMELHRGKKAGTRLKAVYPLCACQRCCDLWLKFDDRPIPNRTGTCFHDYGRCRLRFGTENGITTGDCQGHRKLRLSGFYSIMGGHADWRAVHHSIVVYYDYERLRTVFPPLPLYRHRSRPAFHLCWGTDTERGEKFLEILCGGLFGRRDYRAGLHYLFPVCFLTACG